MTEHWRGQDLKLGMSEARADSPAPYLAYCEPEGKGFRCLIEALRSAARLA